MAVCACIYAYMRLGLCGIDVRVHGDMYARVGAQWALDVAGGLAFLHSRKPFVLHRDLKPVGRVAG